MDDRELDKRLSVIEEGIEDLKLALYELIETKLPEDTTTEEVEDTKLLFKTE